MRAKLTLDSAGDLALMNRDSKVGALKIQNKGQAQACRHIGVGRHVLWRGLEEETF